MYVTGGKCPTNDNSMPNILSTHCKSTPLPVKNNINYVPMNFTLYAKTTDILLLFHGFIDFDPCNFMAQFYAFLTT